jgi:Cof subfamily protein (haloacid dehalogenase superfamily)
MRKLSGMIPAIHAVVLDVDGTVMTSQHSITSATIAAVAEVDRLGVPVILASSRSPLSLATVQSTLGLNGQYFVAYQGALTGRFTESDQFEMLLELPMDLDDARSIAELAGNQGYSVNWYSELTWFVETVDERVRDEMMAAGGMPSIADLTTLTAPPHKLLCIGPAGTTPVQLRELAGQLPHSTIGRHSHTTYLEVTAVGADKQAGVSAVGFHLGFDANQVVAFGDGDNDLGIFAYAGTSVAMGNATAVVAAAATMTTDDHDQDGVANALMMLVGHGFIARRGVS